MEPFKVSENPRGKKMFYFILGDPPNFRYRKSLGKRKVISMFVLGVSVRTEKNAILGIVITWLAILVLSIPVLMSHGVQQYPYNGDIHTVCIFLQKEGAYNKMVFHVSGRDLNFVGNGVWKGP